MAATNKDTGFNASILFPGDPSVGINPRVYHMNLDEELRNAFDDDKELREYHRAKIKDLYEEMDGVDTCVVAFSDETFD